MLNMPTVLRSGPYRLSFYSSDGDEPEHVHVKSDNNEAKFWLAPVRLDWTRGFSQREISTLMALVADHEASLLEAWHDFFGD